DIVDIGHVLVADALDVVLTKAVAQESWAFASFGGDDAGAEFLLQVITGRQRPGRTRRGDKRCQPQARLPRLQCVVALRERRTRARVVSHIVAEFGKLVENDIGRIARELGAFVVDLLDVALRAGGPDDVLRLGRPAAQPLEPLLAHAGRQYRDAA